jgi:hypothetical protein
LVVSEKIKVDKDALIESMEFLYTKNNLTYTARDAISICQKLQILQTKKNGKELSINDITIACYLEIKGKTSHLKADFVSGMESIKQEVLKDIQKNMPEKYQTYETNGNKTKKFIFLEPHKEALIALDFALGLRTLRIGAKTDSAFRDGKRCILLEGEPSVGKSDLAKYYLKSQGYVDCTDEIKESDDKAKNDRKTTKIALAKKTDKIFYQVTASLDGNKIEELVKKAFQEGAVVIVDEINLIKDVEKLLNSYLQGEDENGNKPAKEGFMLIATQNPAKTYGGRQELSEALLNRAEKHIVPKIIDENSIDKIVTVKKGGAKESLEFRKKMVKAYCEASKLEDIPLRELLDELPKETPQHSFFLETEKPPNIQVVSPTKGLTET